MVCILYLKGVAIFDQILFPKRPFSNFFGELHHLSKGAPPNPIFSANSSVRQFFTMPAPLFFMVTIEFFVSFYSLLSWRVLFGASTVNYEIHLLLGGCSNSRVPKS
jgi:hypothetical protein